MLDYQTDLSDRLDYNNEAVCCKHLFLFIAFAVILFNIHIIYSDVFTCNARALILSSNGNQYVCARMNYFRLLSEIIIYRAMDTCVYVYLSLSYL